MKYHIELTRVGRNWSYMVTEIDGSSLTSTGKMLVCESSTILTLQGVKQIAYSYVPEGCEFTVSIDCAKYQRLIGPLVQR